METVGGAHPGGLSCVTGLKPPGDLQALLPAGGEHAEITHRICRTVADHGMFV